MRPEHRKAGAGRALLAAVAARLRERGGERLEWSALDWNELALGFYRGLGARAMTEWVTHRLIGEDLARLAAEAGGGHRCGLSRDGSLLAAARPGGVSPRSPMDKTTAS